MKNYVIILTILFSFISCNNSQKQISKSVESLMNEHISVPISKMITCGNNSTIVNDSSLCMKLLVYEDSMVCSSCELKNIFYWKSLKDSLNKYDRNFDIILIYAPKKKETQKIVYSLKNRDLSFPVYVDTCSIFLRVNKHLSVSPMLHSFVLDEDNRVVLVGNPLRNKKIEDLLLEYVKGGLHDSMNM